MSRVHRGSQRASKVVIIGVHSRVQEAELLRVFHTAGWILEHEKPTKFRFDRTRITFESMVVQDGTQVWRNPRLTEALQPVQNR